MSESIFKMGKSLEILKSSIYEYELPALELSKSPSERAFETIANEINAFQSELGEGEAVGAMLASFGKVVTLQITGIAQTGQFICFDGVTDAGDQARLVQHFTQASVLLIKLKQPVAPVAPIGFIQTS
ncbi:DUF6173 family protein [Burkholderia gladioli]|nr:DUF6173 family protein [Burkholderia gladioli]